MGEWKRSSFCAASECVEAKRYEGVAGELWFVRSNVRPEFQITLTRAEIDAFVKAWQAGEFDREAPGE